MRIHVMLLALVASAAVALTPTHVIPVELHPVVADEDQARMVRCLDLFEDFCLVTESVRGGIDVGVEVEVEVEAPAPQSAA